MCRKNEKTDKELTEYIGSLDFYLLEEDNIFGRKKIKVLLRDFIIMYNFFPDEVIFENFTGNIFSSIFR